MKNDTTALNNPRVIIIQKLYSKFFNNEKKIDFPKHRYKKFIKDVVNGSLERNDIIVEEITNHLKKDYNQRVFKCIKFFLR